MCDGSTPSTDLNRMIEHARALRAKYLDDPHRPGYHFVVPEGVHGPVDPNGGLFWNGRYHLCYIFQHEGKHYWGHISSVDLVHWRHHPPALGPGDGDDGIFSGGAFVDQNGVATITYWGLGNPGGICIATSSDPELDHWTKSPHNPVIRETQHGLAVVPSSCGTGETVYGAADPSAIWFHGGRYYMLTGNLLVLREFGSKRNLPEHLGDTLYLFVSDDLAKWTYLHTFYQSRRKWTQESEDDMCPDFFPLPASPKGGPASDRHMILFISHNLGAQYYIGRYAGGRFEPETHGRMTWVDNEFFAPESLADANGRRIMWSWVFDRREQATRQASGWSGELSLPRVLWLGDDGILRMRPVDELRCLRYNEKARRNLKIKADADLPLEDVRGNSIELSVQIVPGSAKQVGVKVCCSPDGAEGTLIYCDTADNTLKVDTRKSSLGEGPKLVEAAPFALKPREKLELRVFVDKSFVEVFANDRQAVVRRIYPSRADSTGVALFARGGDATVSQLHAWQMMPSNPY
ncbi:MAG TPA: glycoside hydrolase family 32 protein [Planctomycetota bacterium]|nr:glycoside hydrolase family 32 protein [Planctomycetota bacterium]